MMDSNYQIPQINTADFTYDLPEERIAKYPLAERDSSKLLVYKCNTCKQTVFREIPDLIPENSIMVFNDTKVVPARLFFQRSTGAHIEILCLRPEDPVDYSLCFDSTLSCSWKCVVGNIKRWKGDRITVYNPDSNAEVSAVNLSATLVRREDEGAIVRFEWDGGVPFSKVLEVCGNIPIPPYLNRETEEIDHERYQTTYARYNGSVAAPTAGLHFTPEVLERIRNERQVDTETVCLHVGAGTFLPVKDGNVSAHLMHREPFIVKLDLLRRLRRREGKIVAVGTTSVRTLESLYYVGAGIIESSKVQEVAQWAPYTRDYPYSMDESLDAIIGYLEANSLSALCVPTKIIIVPGFKFRLVDVLVTNFHQPQSTLLLLISAFTGDDNWRRIYKFAMDNDFRFLSYGDSSILFR